jgi:hypothetical protein
VIARQGFSAFQRPKAPAICQGQRIRTVLLSDKSTHCSVREAVKLSACNDSGFDTLAHNFHFCQKESASMENETQDKSIEIRSCVLIERGVFALTGYIRKYYADISDRNRFGSGGIM